MIEETIRNILYGLIASSLFGLFVGVIGQVVKTRGETITGMKAVGWVLYLVVMLTYFVGITWYWFNLLANI